VIGGISSADSVTFTPGSGYAIEELVPSERKLMVEDQRKLSAGAISVNATMSISRVWVAVMATFKPAP